MQITVISWFAIHPFEETFMSKAMEETKAALAELIEAARIGNIIPVRLTGQLEAIQDLLLQTDEEHAQEIEELKNVPDGDAGEVILENAAFLRTAVHELRTPMTSVRGYSDMLVNESMSGPLSDMQKQLLAVVRTNAKRMEGLLSDMSNINKLRSGTLQTSIKMELYKNVAQRAEKSTRAIAEELKREVIFEVPDGLPLLNTDGEFMALALEKMIENGLRYSPEDGGKVTVGAQKDNNTLVITIRDNGCGMTAEEMARLGEMFFRGENEVVRAYKGSGLGIPIAYGLIDVLGGTRKVESTPGEGTTFTLRFEGMS